MALMIQARHLFYGLAMLERYKGYGLRSFYMIFAMSDETFSITCSAEPPEGVDRGWFMFFITLLDQCYWVASAGLGAVVGSVLPFSTEGVDFVMTAMFTVIFLNQWEKDRQHYSALIGLAAPLACLVFLAPAAFCCPPWDASWCCCWLCVNRSKRPKALKQKKAARRWAHDRSPDGPDHCSVHRRYHDHPLSALCGVLFQGSAAAGDGVVSGPGAARRHLWYADRLLPEKRHPFAGDRGIPEAIALLVTVGLHKWKHETLLSVAGGTLCYVLLVQLVF